MTTLVGSGGDCWQDVPRAGGATALPRWARRPRPGTAEHMVRVPGEAVAVLRQLGFPVRHPSGTRS
ncbi:hypothetical protein GCM10023321_32180 [Pseudonocardia eucalypti]|uniref:Uncharacterized protein n=1 Tax=Pseudonocardia eucalypti TaxID=648755 RepID=A0ABP9Q6H6_9PSEU|nr:hypothetical protein [Pseudonocardia eucalypti]